MSVFRLGGHRWVFIGGGVLLALILLLAFCDRGHAQELRVTPEVITLTEGDALTLQATTKRSGSKRWASSFPAVASVDGTGRVRALSPGRTTVSVRVGNLYASSRVTVLAGEPTDTGVPHVPPDTTPAPEPPPPPQDTVVPAPPPPPPADTASVRIRGVYLTENLNRLRELRSGDTVRLDGRTLNVEVTTEPAEVTYVLFQRSGAYLNDEWYAPYTAFGDRHEAGRLEVGSYQLTITPHLPQIVAGAPLQLALTVVAGTGPQPPPPPPPTDTVAPPPPPPPTDTVVVPPGATVAELPRGVPNSALPTTTRDVRVPAGANLQTYLDNAQPGDRILLPAGAVFTGEFRWSKNLSPCAVLQTDTNLPALGTRIGPGLPLATIRAPSTQPALRAVGRSGGLCIRGVRFDVAPAQTLSYGIVELGWIWNEDQDTWEEVPGPFLLRQVEIVGHATLDVSRCLALNSDSTAVLDSYLHGCHAKGRDSQAIGIFNGPGPFLIENNYLEGAAENIMAGGADPRVPNLVPSDMTIRRNHLYKPLSWQGGPWSVKNLFELKNARRVLVEGNVMENNWVNAQDGHAVLFQVTNQDGNAPWVIVADVTFRNNVVRNSPHCFNMNRYTWGTNVRPENWLQRVHHENNLCEQISGRGATLQGGIRDLVFERNTINTQYMGMFMSAEGDPLTRPVWRGNLIQVPQGAYGFFGNATAENLHTWAVHTKDAVFVGNALPGRPAGAYPNAGANFFGATPPAGVGVDRARLDAAIAGVATPPRGRARRN